MTSRIWVILGATSIIAEEFAHLAAKAGHHLRLVGRDKEQLTLIAQDLKLRYHVLCDVIIMDMMEQPDKLLTVLAAGEHELDLFVAHSDFTGNDHLTSETIHQLIQINVTAAIQLIHTYLHSGQNKHQLLYLSSVAACRGRAKNSLYGASKAAVEVYLQGLQQAASKNQTITIARLGFIDTKQTYGLPGIFHAAQPIDCAKACWHAINRKKRMFYYPRFWQTIMGIITRLPFFLFKSVP